MKIIVLKDAGQSTALQFDRRRTWLAGFVGLAIVAGLGSWMAYAHRDVGADLLVMEHWQDTLTTQQSELETLRTQYTAQSDAMGRQLAQLQARLMRMEAVGSRVAQVASLEEAEFSFDSPAATGGPTASSEDLPLYQLQRQMNGLALNMAGTERELNILESLLSDKEYRSAKALAGRPITWGWMSSPFGSRVDPISGKNAWHNGVDFAGREGSEVIAVAGGLVTYAGHRSGYGKMVEITHGDGYVTRYGHHKEVLVKLGDVVKPSHAIGLMGSSGRSTGPHVHLEVLKDGRHVDPAKYVATRR